MKSWIASSVLGLVAVAGCKFDQPADKQPVDAAPLAMTTLAVAVAGDGTIVSDPLGIVCGTMCMSEFPVGSTVTLTAEPAVGWEVASWTGTGATCGAGQRSCAVAMTQARTVEVTFVRGFALTVAVTGSGAGTVTGGGIDCATGNVGTCAITIGEGQQVTLSQAPGAVGAGSQIALDGWGGDCASRGTSATCSLTMDAAKSASFGYTLQHRLSLTLASSDGGAGSVTANPGGFACATGTCSRFFDAGGDVTITPTPATSLDAVSSVTGDCGALPCTLASLAGPAAVTTTFLRTACVPSTTSCTLGRLTQCDGTGNFVSYLVPNGAADGSATTLVMNGYQCPLGCAASGTRCNDVDASNGLNAALDSPAVSPTGVDLVLPRVGNTTAGTATVGAYDAVRGTAAVVDTDGQTLDVPAQQITQGTAPTILVLKVRSLKIMAGTTLRATNGSALAIVSHFDIFVAGTVDLSSKVGEPFPGGGSETQEGGCSGLMGSKGSGGGAGYGNGGHGADSTNTGGSGFRDATHPLRGGCDGFVLAPGGGAVQLVSRTRVAIGPTGLVNVSGQGGVCWGLFGAASYPSGGGGGGTIVIESPLIDVAPGGAVTGRGGSGAACENLVGGVVGFDGPSTGVSPAPSVTCTRCGTSGVGGYEAGRDGGNAALVGTDGFAGGGGGVGTFAGRNQSGVLTLPSLSRRIGGPGAGLLGRREPTP